MTLTYLTILLISNENSDQYNKKGEGQEKAGLGTSARYKDVSQIAGCSLLGNNLDLLLSDF